MIGPASLAYLERETRTLYGCSDYGKYVVINNPYLSKLRLVEVIEAETFHLYYEFIYFPEPDFLVEVRRKV